MTEQTTRLELIHRYQQIKQAVIDATDAGRPICAVQAGDLMALAEKLSIMEKTQDFIKRSDVIVLYGTSTARTPPPGLIHQNMMMSVALSLSKTER